MEKIVEKRKFKLFREKLGYNQTSFANKLNIATGSIGMIESEAEKNTNRVVTANIKLKIKEALNIDFDRDVDAEGNVIIRNNKPENIIAIPFHDIGAAAGAGTMLNEEPPQDVMYFDKRFLDTILKVPNYSALHIIYAKGDSMDSGWNQPNDIKDGDLLIVDTSQTTGNNHIFVILVNNTELRVKKLFKRGEALYISSNNSKYKEEVYYPDNTDFEVKVIGKVVWNGRKENV